MFDKRLAKATMERVRGEWGRSFDLLGPRLQRAVLAEAVLSIANTRDGGEDDPVRRILTDGLAWAHETTGR